MTAALLFGEDVDLALNFVWGVMLPGLARTCPRSTSSFLVPRRSTPTLSPAWPWSKILRNISTEVATVLAVGRKPTISTSSPGLTIPRSTRPVTTVPRPEMEKTSSTGMRKGLSSVADRLRDVGVAGIEQLKDRFAVGAVCLAVTALEGLQRRALDDGDIVAGELIGG